MIDFISGLVCGLALSYAVLMLPTWANLAKILP